MSTILITGGAGFIPSSLADSLSNNKNNTVVLIDNFLTGKKENIPLKENVIFIKGDANNYNDLNAIMTSYRFDYVFHYAAVVGVTRTLENPIEVLRDLDGIKSILELSKNTGVKRVFYSSSSEVYGEPVELPQHELTTPLNSRLPYAIVKNVGEAFCKSYKQEYDLDYTIFRFFNTYGPKQSTDFVMSKFIRAALKNEPLSVYGEGSQTRTFCYIDDNIDCTIRCMEENLHVNDVINIGNSIEISILELAKEVIKACNSSSEIIHLPPLEEGDMTRRQPDISKMQRTLNRDLTPLREGIQKVVSHLK